MWSIRCRSAAKQDIELIEKSIRIEEIRKGEPEINSPWCFGTNGGKCEK